MSEEKKWLASRDGECFNCGPFDTREEAIAEAPFDLDLEEDEEFYVCASVPLEFQFTQYVDSYLERLFEQNEKICGEWNEQWQEDIQKDEELEKEIAEKLREIEEMILKKHPQVMMEGESETINNKIKE